MTALCLGLLTLGSLLWMAGSRRNGLRLIGAAVLLAVAGPLVLLALARVLALLPALAALVLLAAVAVAYVRFARHRSALKRAFPERSTSLKRRVDPGP